MVVEDERDTYEGNFDELPFYDNVDNSISQLKLGEETFGLYKRYIQNNIQLRNRQNYRQLQADLVEYIRQFHNAC